MASNLVAFIFVILVFIPLKSHSFADKPSWVKAGYYYSGSEVSASDIKATLFTHLLCAFAFINTTNYKIFINSSEEHKFATFTNTVKLQNPSVSTLLSIWGGREDSSVFTSMLNQSSYRKSFIDSTIRAARQHGFQGIDLYGVWPRQGKDLANFGTLLKEWRATITSEARNSSKSELILVMAGYYLKASDSLNYPFESMQMNLDWVHFVAYDYYLPRKDNVTGFHAALYGPSDWDNTDYGIREWRRRGFSSSKLVIGLPYHGYAWTLVNPGNKGVGTPASGLFQVYELWEQGRGVEFLDPSLDDTTSPCKIMRCMQVALLCVQENPAVRPSMLEVYSLLKNEAAAIGTPKMPCK